MKNMLKAGGKKRDYDLYRCHPDTNVDELGGFTYPQGETIGENRPVLIYRVRKGKSLPLS
jgi:hypothetical protein